MAKAKAERKADQPNFVQPVVRLAPYTLNLEYRMPGLKAPASVHETEGEIFFVIEGTGTAVTGGRLIDEKRSNPENLSGTGIEGGETRRIAKGDVLFVPQRSPHWFNPADGGPLVLLSLHVPRK
jgi:mannose-6-phosphate isomerase-like protein (cupin superfamily)